MKEFFDHQMNKQMTMIHWKQKEAIKIPDRKSNGSSIFFWIFSLNIMFVCLFVCMSYGCMFLFIYGPSMWSRPNQMRKKSFLFCLVTWLNRIVMRGFLFLEYWIILMIKQPKNIIFMDFFLFCLFILNTKKNNQESFF